MKVIRLSDCHRPVFGGEVNVFNRDDFMNVPEIAAEFRVSGDAVRRWIHKKYLDPIHVEVHGGAYYVTKEAVQLWKNALNGQQPMRGKRLPALAGFKGIYSAAEHESQE